tara:strand:+ start:973 stop:1146 length:174 start_codon:yes stop_codon:yes gene_type:complete
MWYIPAGILEMIFWLTAIWVSYRLNVSLHRNPHQPTRMITVHSATLDEVYEVEIDVK